MRRDAAFEKAIKDLDNYKLNFGNAASLWSNQLAKLNARYPNDRFEIDNEITRIMQREGVSTYTTNGFTTIEVNSNRTVEIPVQDARTKHLLHLLLVNFKNLSAKYPKLSLEID